MTQQTGITIRQSLSQVYPGIAGQLENRHTSVYSLIHMSFSKIYQDTPEFYICVNRTLNIMQIKDTMLKASIGCENGVILAISKTFKDSSIFVNGKGLENQLQFTCKGSLKSSEQSQLTKIIKSSIQIAIEDCSTSNLHGGIIYFQSQLSKNDETSLLLAFALAGVVINSLQNDYTLQQIEQKVSKFHNKPLHLSKHQVQKILIFKNIQEQRSITLQFFDTKFMVGDLMQSQEQFTQINNVNKRLKLEMDFLQNLICWHLKIQTMSLDKVIEHLGCSLQIFQQICLGYLKDNYTIQELNSFLPINTIEYPQFSPKNRLALFISQMQKLQLLIISPTIQTLNLCFLRSLSQSRSLGLISARVDAIITTCLNDYGSSCCIVQDKYLLVVTTKQKFMWLFQTFKKLALVDSSGQSMVQGNIQHLLFSTGPSAGLSLLNLSGEMWY